MSISMPRASGGEFFTISARGYQFFTERRGVPVFYWYLRSVLYCTCVQYCTVPA
eukprot:COSAG02_NODE_25121_length_668_cov_1.706503_1_plen_53_part_10